MWAKIKNGILSHPALSIAISLIVIIGIASVGYLVVQKGDSSKNNKTAIMPGSGTESCDGLVQIGAVSVEKDPAGDPEAWLRFDYSTTAKEDLNCQYTITFYNSQEDVIRTISNVEDSFLASGGQIYNGYSDTPYQEGMTARVTVP